MRGEINLTICDFCGEVIEKIRIKKKLWTHDIRTIESGLGKTIEVGEYDIPFKCNYCDGNFCSEHRLPESHGCVGLPEREWKGDVIVPTSKSHRKELIIKTQKDKEEKSHDWLSSSQHIPSSVGVDEEYENFIRGIKPEKSKSEKPMIEQPTDRSAETFKPLNGHRLGISTVPDRVSKKKYGKHKSLSGKRIIVKIIKFLVFMLYTGLTGLSHVLNLTALISMDGLFVMLFAFGSNTLLICVLLMVAYMVSWIIIVYKIIRGRAKWWYHLVLLILGLGGWLYLFLILRVGVLTGLSF